MHLGPMLFNSSYRPTVNRKLSVLLSDCRRETQYSKQKSTKRKLGEEDHVNSADVPKDGTAETLSQAMQAFCLLLYEA